MQRFFALPLAGWLALGVLFAWDASPARASEFNVRPLSLSLSGESPSATLAVTNASKEPLRFHIKVFKWGQTPDGETQLEPTRDIVFFPAMLALQPGESRQVRVGTKIQPAAVERSYRIFVQELPPLARTQREAVNVVRMLTKMGVPVFIEAKSPVVTPLVTAPVAQGRKVSFSIRNTGTAHLQVQKVVLEALADGDVIHTEELPAWYVLAGGSRRHIVELSDDVCARATSLRARIESRDGSPEAELPQFRCGGG